jgi:hypothetical protein
MSSVCSVNLLSGNTVIASDVGALYSISTADFEFRESQF